MNYSCKKVLQNKGSVKELTKKNLLFGEGGQ